jgi:ankyrin repeat protein
VHFLNPIVVADRATAGASLSAEDAGKRTPAHLAALNGHEGCLRALYELGAGVSLSAEDAGKRTPAHDAARKGHEGCLRVLYELGAGATLSAEDANKQTPAHEAAANGHEGCLRVLHECLALMIDPLLKGLAGEIVPMERGESRGDSVKVYSDKPRCFIGRYEPARRERYSCAALPESGRQDSRDVRVARTIDAYASVAAKDNSR